MIEVVEGVVQKLHLEPIIKSLHELLLFVTVLSDISWGIPSQLQELVTVLCDRHSSLLESEELLPLHLHKPSGHMVSPEGLAELSPGEVVASLRRTRPEVEDRADGWAPPGSGSDAMAHLPVGERKGEARGTWAPSWAEAQLGRGWKGRLAPGRSGLAGPVGWLVSPPFLFLFSPFSFLGFFKIVLGF